jgi:alpha-L-rhamnosidase
MDSGRNIMVPSVILHPPISKRGEENRFEADFDLRYAEITGYEDLKLSDVVAIFISSDLRRTGTFDCSHELINQLHHNTVASTRGNFISLPTDCPQRDERFGWTGDIAVFASTANYLFDTSAFLGSWLGDLAAEQRRMDGNVPVIVPRVPLRRQADERPMAIWADACITVPFDIYEASGDQSILAKQWDSMRMWLDRGLPRNKDGFYSECTPQYGDWLDPKSPPQLPGHGRTDPFFVANAYLIYVTRLAAKIGIVLGKTDVAARYSKDADELMEKFEAEYITKNGRLTSDTQTAYCLGLLFGLFHSDSQIRTAKSRLDWLIRWDNFKVGTGFAGTPVILKVLAEHGMLNLAYRLLQERDCPSWLHPITMGATTIVSLSLCYVPSARSLPSLSTPCITAQQR